MELTKKDLKGDIVVSDWDQDGMLVDRVRGIVMTVCPTCLDKQGKAPILKANQPCPTCGWVRPKIKGNTCTITCKRASEHGGSDNED